MTNMNTYMYMDVFASVIFQHIIEVLTVWQLHVGCNVYSHMYIMYAIYKIVTINFMFQGTLTQLKALKLIMYDLVGMYTHVLQVLKVCYWAGHINTTESINFP